MERDDISWLLPRPEAVEVTATNAAAGEKVTHYSSPLFGGCGPSDKTVKDFRRD
jgi:hypothetical protein